MIQLQQQNVRPPHVRFEQRAVEDRTQSLENGRYASRDVDIAYITPIGQKDTVEREVTEWLRDSRKKAEDGRMPENWPDHFERIYAAWKKGLDLPLEGTPIKGWTVLSPAQQANLLAFNIKTVEDLAALTDEGLSRVGMGAVTLKNKAKAWLEASTDSGAIAEKVAALLLANKEKDEQIATLMATVNELKVLLPEDVRVATVKEGKSKVDNLL